MTRALPALALVCLLAAVGCGESRPGDESGDRVATAPSTAGGAAATRAAEAAPPPAGRTKLVDPRAGGLRVAMGEYSLEPEAATIRPGRVTFVIDNVGTLRHGFELEVARRDDQSGGDRDRSVDLETQLVAGGEQTRLTANLAPGVYSIECFVDGHDDLGMEGTIRVATGAPLVRAAAPSPATRSEGGATTHTVRIEGFSFIPATLEVAVGDTVVWRNEDSAPHTATAPNGDPGPASPQLATGEDYSLVIRGSRDIAYICALHPHMRGRIVVRAA